MRGDGRIDFARGSGAGRIELTHELGHLQGMLEPARLAPLALGVDVDVGFRSRPPDGRRQGPEKNRKGRPAAADGTRAAGGSVGLRGLDIDGVIRFGSLKAGGLKLGQAALPVAVH